MKKFISFILIYQFVIFLCKGNSSEGWIFLDKTNIPSSEIKLKECKHDLKNNIIEFSLNAYKLVEVQTPNGKAYIIRTPNDARILKKGAPDLPLYAKSLIIPDLDEMQVNILSSKYIEIPNINVAPSKGNLLRTINPESVPYTYGIEYQQNSFYPTTLAYLREPYILRDFRGQALVIQPVQYNPVTKILRIYTKIVLEVKSTGNIGQNIFNRTKTLNSIDKEFNEIYIRQFINYSEAAKYTPLSDLPGNMLIICYDNFLSAMQPFVNWKIMKGIPTQIVPVSVIGNNVNSLKNYIANYFNNNGLTYLLLVGDFAQVTSPTSNFSGVTGAKDNEYAYILGNDHYQEFLVGRFSAESVADVQTQVERSIYYEKTLSSGDWLAATLGIGSDEGPGDDNEYDYQHIRNIQTKLIGYTYTTRYELYDGSQGGLDAPGNPTAANVSTVVNPGIGSIFYCGHGGQTQWVTTGFSNSNVASLTNVNKLPFILTVSCVVGHFNEGTCFCEAWMRSKQTSGPVGAIAIFGSTINQSWSPPMEAQDEAIDILVESYSNNIKRTFAGICVNGCFKMNDTYADFDMTDTWTLFGDPSLVMRTKNPMSMTVSHPSTITAGTPTLDVSCNVNGAYVAVTYQNQILGVGYVTNGNVQISLNPVPVNVGDTLTVCVTAFNYTTYIGYVEIIANNLNNDAHLLSIIEPALNYNCSGINITPKIVIRNAGIQNLTSVTINYQLDNGNIISQNWTGNLSTNQKDTVLLQSFTLTQGNHSFRAFLTNPNNTLDEYPSNDEKFINFTVNNLTFAVDFTADKTTSCDVPLTVNFTNNSQNITSFLWDFGDGTTSTLQNPTHVYNDLGSYTVTLIGDAGICGTFTETKNYYIVVGALPPIINDTTICGINNNVTLFANGSGLIQWFNSQSASSPIDTGSTITINNLNNDTTLWVNQIIHSPNLYGGNYMINSNGSMFVSTYQHYLVFDCYSPATLVSVEVNAGSSGNRTIQLKDANNNILQSRTVYIPQGISRINLDFNLPVQNDLRLVGPASPNLWRNNDSCSYPYNISDIISIKYSSASTNPTGYYYYFYNWEISIPDCESPKVPVNVSVSDFTLNVTHTDETGPNMNDGTASVQATGDGPFTFVWSNGATTQTVNQLTGGTYYVTVTNIYGCTKVDSVIINTLASLNTNLFANDLIIYPNPAQNFVKIFYNFLPYSTIKIFDTKSRLVLIKQIDNSTENIELDISKLNNGFYTLEVFTLNTIIRKKLIKN